MTFFEPSPVLYAFLFAQQFVYLPFIAVLALVRLAIANGPSRLWALVALVLACAAMFLQFGPALMGLYRGPLPIFAGEATRWAGGMALPLVTSFALWVAAFVRGRRWWLIDWIHVAALLGFVGLFAWVRLV